MKKIKLNIIKEQLMSAEELRKNCPEIIKTYDELVKNKGESDPQAYSMLQQYQQCLQARDAAAKIEKGEISKEQWLNSVNMDQFDMAGSHVYEESARQFRQGIRDLNFSADPGINANPDQLKTQEQNDCLGEWGSYIGQAALISTFYVGIKTVLTYSLDPKFRTKNARIPPVMESLGKMVKAMGEKAKKSGLWPKWLANLLEEVDGKETEAMQKLVDRMARKTPANATPEDLRTMGQKLKDGAFNPSVAGAWDGAKSFTRGTIKVAGWSTLIGAIGWGGTELLNWMLGSDEHHTATETLSSIAKSMMILDLVPKYIVLDQGYAAFSEPETKFNTNDPGNPCGLIGPLLGLTIIAVGRSRGVGQWARGSFKHGLYGGGKQGLRQIDLEQYYLKIADRIGRRFENTVESYADYLRARQEEWAEQFIGAASKSGRLHGAATYPHLPKRVMEAYSTWAQEILKSGKAGLGAKVGKKKELKKRILKAFQEAQKNGELDPSLFPDGKIKSLDDLPPGALDELGFFAETYGDAMVRISRQTEKRFYDQALAVVKAPNEVPSLVTRFKNWLMDMKRGRTNDAAKSDLGELGGNQVKDASGSSTKEVAEAMAKQGGDSIEAGEKVARINKGNPKEVFEASDDAADAMRFQLEDVWRALKGADDASDTAVKLSDFIKYINRNAKIREELFRRVIKRFFTDSDVEEIVKALDEVPPGPVTKEGHEAAVVYDLLVKKFAPDASRATPSPALSAREVEEIREELSKIIEFARNNVDAPVKKSFRDNKAVIALLGSNQSGLSRIYQVSITATVISIVGGIVWYYNTLARKKIKEGEFYFAGENLGPIGSGFQQLLNSAVGGAAAAQSQKLIDAQIQRVKENSPDADVEEVEDAMNAAAIEKLILLPRISKRIKTDLKKDGKMTFGDTTLEAMTKSAPMRKAKFTNRLDFWMSLVNKPEQYKDLNQEQLWGKFQNAVAKDMQVMINQDPEHFSDFRSKVLNQPHVLEMQQFQYGSPSILKVELKKYVDAPDKKLKWRYESIDRMFSHRRSQELSEDEAVEARSKVVKKRAKAFRESEKETLELINSVTAAIDRTGEERSVGADFNYSLRLKNATRQLESILPGNLSRESRRELVKLRKLIKESAETGGGQAEKQKLIRLINSKLRTDAAKKARKKREDMKEHQKERKIMENEDLRKLIKELLNENTGQGYNPYPYHSHIGEEGEESPDFLQDWKDFELALVRDETRSTAIEVAKILVKDLELFGDVIDLVGKNQSVAVEILKNLRKNEKNS